MRAAEAARELRFDQPVDARWLEAEAVRASLAAELDASFPAELIRRDAELKEMLGLLPVGVDLRRALLDFQAEAVVGFYTPLRDRLYRVRGSRVPSAREADSILVHELVHALQAAHSPLMRAQLGLTDDDDLGFALGALLEGDAQWASFRFSSAGSGREPVSPDDFARDISMRWADSVHAGTPRLLRESFLLRYPAGYRLAVGLVEAGDVAALDAALRDPPLSSEELLHPELYLDPRRRRPLQRFDLSEAPRPEPCRSLGSNRFGELGLRIWAQERGADAERAADLARGWDTDAALGLVCPGGRSFAWLLQFDTPQAARRLAGAAPGLADGLAAERGLSAPVEVDLHGRRVLLSAGLSAAQREHWLRRLEARSFATLEAYLEARPEILLRADTLRTRARGEAR